MHRICPKCNRDHQQTDYIKVKCKFFIDGYTPICIDCLESMIDNTDLAQVDALMRWLDIPFIPDHWTRLYDQAKDQTLRYYIQLIGTSLEYENTDWSYANALWKEAQENKTEIDHIAGANNNWLMKMARKWPAEIDRTVEDYHYLEDLYEDLIATQHLTTATQRDDAKRLCEIGLVANKKIRAGLDAKNEMSIYHNIIKAEGFEPKNSKNAGDFESVGRLNLLTLNFSNCWELLVA